MEPPETDLVFVTQEPQERVHLEARNCGTLFLCLAREAAPLSVEGQYEGRGHQGCSFSKGPPPPKLATTPIAAETGTVLHTVLFQGNLVAKGSASAAIFGNQMND